MKSTFALAALALVGCGTSPSRSVPAAAAASCTASPAGRFEFLCTDANASLGEHADQFTFILDGGVLTVKNTSAGASAAAGDFLADTAAFAPYKRNSALDRSACRYQTAGKGTFYTYKIAAALFQGQKGEISLYDDGGERMSSAFLDCAPKR